MKVRNQRVLPYREKALEVAIVDDALRSRDKIESRSQPRRHEEANIFGAAVLAQQVGQDLEDYVD